MTEKQEGQASISDQGSWSGKMSPEHSQATKERTSKQSCRQSSASRTIQPQFLSLRKENGRVPDVSWATLTPSLGERLMPNTGESPQRRKRIYLVADFGGDTAPKILFEREGLSRDFAESREAWQRAAGDIKEGTHKAGTENVECYDISDRRRVADKSEVSPTLTTKMGTGGNNVPIVIETHAQDARWGISEDNIVQTLASNMGTGGAMYR